MLDDLMNAITRLQSCISTHSPVLTQNELRTRIALIDPILGALGWDVTDPSQVIIEYSTSHGNADYALLRDGRPIAVIEAKKLNEPLKRHTIQMLTYANAQGIEYALLTNGDTWEMYDVFKPVSLDEKKIVDVNLSSASAHSSALHLLALWNTSLDFGQSIPAKSPVFPPEGVSPNDGHEWTKLSEFKPNPGTKCPSRIRYWDGAEVELQTWRELLLQTVAITFEQNLLTSKMLPMGTKKRNYIHTKPVNPDGTSMKAVKQVKNTPLFVSLHFSGVSAIRRVRTLLSTCNIDDGSVHVCR